MVPTSHFLILGAILFTIGLVGVVSRRNFLTVFMSIELMLNAVNLTFLAFSKVHGHLDGHAFVFFVITVAAAEAAVGLAIAIAIFRRRKTVNVDEVDLLKH
jgi:NADH-quinone oxidoreductase subunit K